MVQIYKDCWGKVGLGDAEVGIVLEKCLPTFSPSLGFESLACLTLRSEFSSYSSLNWANILKYWMSLWYIMSWEYKAVQNFFLPVDNWKEVQE